MLTNDARSLIKLGEGGSYSASRDAIKHQLWDTRTFNTTISNFTFFSQPIGSAWRNNSIKSINETNLNDSGKLPNGQTFMILRMGVGLISAFPLTNTNCPDVAQAFINIMQSSVFEITLAGRSFDFQVHGRQFLPALAINGDNASTVNSSHRVGDVITSAWINLHPGPIYLDQLVSFTVQHTLNNPDTNIVTLLNSACSTLNTIYSSMQVTLEGFLTRAK